MDPIVKTIVVLTVQFQRDVTIKLENVLMDAKGDGNSLHVIQVRHIPIFKLYNLTVMFTYYRSFF